MKELIEALGESISGEAFAKQKYELFSEKALGEEDLMCANLFKALSFAESIHLNNHLNALNKIAGTSKNFEDITKIDEDELKDQVKSTQVNLLNARVNETFEFKKKYKNFVKLAKKEDQEVAMLSFTYARMAEKAHAELLNNCLKAIHATKPMEEIDFFVCKNCGNVMDAIPSKCPICEKPSKYYEKITI